ncbi:MAG: threonylcarbamoyl-AMP synthase [Rhodospirillaceae bacterium]|nr:threonylcarbamoyl-AMP synthase [Rhodospirillaceae bacterium]
MSVVAADPAGIARAAQILRDGGLVAFPTETVYGLGADATNGQAVARIFEAKGRPSFNPLIVHIAEAGDVHAFAVAPDHFAALAKAFWPGPLTLVMRRKPASPVSDLVSAGGSTIALRMPDAAAATALLRATGRPLAAPSANRSGGISPTRAEHVAASLGKRIDLILDAGPCRVGLESTVLDITRATPAILRPGSVTREQIAAVIGAVVAGADDPSAPKSPGTQLSHYAPSLPLRINASAVRPSEAFLGFGPGAATLNLSPTGDLREAAANLFAMLRALDDANRFTGIAVAAIPDRDVGVAINDRLRRAAHQNP